MEKITRLVVTISELILAHITITSQTKRLKLRKLEMTAKPRKSLRRNNQEFLNQKTMTTNIHSLIIQTRKLKEAIVKTLTQVMNQNWLQMWTRNLKINQVTKSKQEEILEEQQHRTVKLISKRKRRFKKTWRSMHQLVLKSIKSHI